MTYLDDDIFINKAIAPEDGIKIESLGWEWFDIKYLPKVVWDDTLVLLIQKIIYGKIYYYYQMVTLRDSGQEVKLADDHLENIINKIQVNAIVLKYLKLGALNQW